MDAARQAAERLHRQPDQHGRHRVKTDRPFDQGGERRNPWWGDPSYRILPATATSPDVQLYHLHITPLAEQDLNCLFPLQRLQEVAQAGDIGRVAPRHYSIMGYILRPEQLLAETVPAIIRDLKEESPTSWCWSPPDRSAAGPWDSRS